MGFKGTFSVNFELPDYIGLGKSVSRGFGTVKQASYKGFPMRRQAKKGFRRRLGQNFPPFWLSRLDLVKAEFRSTHWPATVEEGLYQVLALSDQGWAQLISSLKAENPGASAGQLENAAHRLLRRWDAARRALLSIRESR